MEDTRTSGRIILSQSTLALTEAAIPSSLVVIFFLVSQIAYLNTDNDTSHDVAIKSMISASIFVGFVSLLLLGLAMKEVYAAGPRQKSSVAPSAGNDLETADNHSNSSSSKRNEKIGSYLLGSCISITVYLSASLLLEVVCIGECGDISRDIKLFEYCNPHSATDGLPLESTFALIALPLLNLMAFQLHSSTTNRYHRGFFYAAVLIGVMSWGSLALCSLAVSIVSLAPILLLHGTLLLVLILSLRSQTRFRMSDAEQTWRQETEQEIASLRNTEMRLMIGNLAHDLKTPLMSFMSGIDHVDMMVQHVLQLSQASSQPSSGSSDGGSFSAAECASQMVSMQDCVLSIRDTSSFMIMAINRCIDYSKATSGVRLVPNFETVDLREALHTPLKIMSNLQQRISINSRFGGDNSVAAERAICSHIITDKQWLQENLLCLLSNAVKYSIEGAVDIEVKLLSSSSHGNDSAKGSIASLRSNYQPHGDTNIVLESPRKPRFNRSFSPRGGFVSSHRETLNSVSVYSGGSKSAPTMNTVEENVVPGSGQTMRPTNSVALATDSCEDNTLQPFRFDHSKNNSSSCTASAKQDNTILDVKSASIVEDSDGADAHNAVRSTSSCLRPPSIITSPISVQSTAASAENQRNSNSKQLSRGRTELLDDFSRISVDRPSREKTSKSPISDPNKHNIGSEPVDVANDDDGEAYILVEVHDTGIGLSEEAMQALFKPFKQAQRMAGGTGLGLFSLAKRLEALGGLYGVRRRRDGGQGTVFWFAIPYKPDFAMSATLQQEPLVERRSCNPTSEQIHQHPDGDFGGSNVESFKSINTNCEQLNILVVDDAPLILKMTTVLLKRKGHKVLTAENGAVALEMMLKRYEKMDMSASATSIETGRGGTKGSSSCVGTTGSAIDDSETGGNRFGPGFGFIDSNGGVSHDVAEVSDSNGQCKVVSSFDIVVMDLQMPIMDGLEAIRRLRAEEAALSAVRGCTFHQRVVCCSANSSHETRQEALDAGGDAFIAKPFSLQAFEDTVDRLH